jgi:hypothetical protein
MANNLQIPEPPRPFGFPTVAAHRRERLRLSNLARRQRRAARMALKPIQAAAAREEGSTGVPESGHDTGLTSK